MGRSGFLGPVFLSYNGNEDMMPIGVYERTPETRIKMGISQRTSVKAIAHRTVMHTALKRWWASMTLDARQKHLAHAWNAARHARSPNKAELRLFKIIENLGFPRFTGSGTVRIGSKYPDFVHSGLPVVVEMFGNWWHKGDDGRARRAYLARRGYRMVIVRERELSHPDVIRRRVERALN